MDMLQVGSFHWKGNGRQSSYLVVSIKLQISHSSENDGIDQIL